MTPDYITQHRLCSFMAVNPTEIVATFLTALIITWMASTLRSAHAYLTSGSMVPCATNTFVPARLDTGAGSEVIMLGILFTIGRSLDNPKNPPKWWGPVMAVKRAIAPPWEKPPASVSDGVKTRETLRMCNQAICGTGGCRCWSLPGSMIQRNPALFACPVHRAGLLRGRCSSTANDPINHLCTLFACCNFLLCQTRQERPFHDSYEG